MSGIVLIVKITLISKKTIEMLNNKEEKENLTRNMKKSFEKRVGFGKKCYLCMVNFIRSPIECQTSVNNNIKLETKTMPLKK